MAPAPMDSATVVRGAPAGAGVGVGAALVWSASRTGAALAAISAPTSTCSMGDAVGGFMTADGGGLDLWVGIRLGARESSDPIAIPASAVAVYAPMDL
ncbi:MAG TPA: hypothetical protein VL460_05235 [Caulobacteraceae bacterium]|nr:hypothetical protein [Caulobacteraceae bacterium]